jgi:5-methylcytosine-specific restriction endonuclease McrA
MPRRPRTDLRAPLPPVKLCPARLKATAPQKIIPSKKLSEWAVNTWSKYLEVKPSIPPPLRESRRRAAQGMHEVVDAVAVFLQSQGISIPPPISYKRVGAAIQRYREVFFGRTSKRSVSKRKARKLITRFYNDEMGIGPATQPSLPVPVKQKHAKRAQKAERFTAEYIAYLESPEWRAFRQRIFLERGRECERCSTTAKGARQVHHLHYRNLGHELPEDVQVLCLPCHTEIHKGKKISLAPAL